MGVLLVLMTIGGLIVAGLLFTVALYTGKVWLRNFVFGGVALWFIFYGAMLLGSSLLSTERNLRVGEPKEFCGFYLDCHMHAAVTRVRRTGSIGGQSASGEFFLVTVNVFSEAKAATLGLLTVEAKAIDEKGRQYERNLSAEALLPDQPPFEQKIGPNGRFEKVIVFDMPADVQSARLDIREGYWIDHIIETFLVGDEDSLLHKRNYFNLSDERPFGEQ